MIALLIINLLVRLKDKKIYLTLLSVIICVEIFSFTCGNILKIPKGDLRENLCVPIQQMAHIAYQYQCGIVDLPEEAITILGELFTDMEGRYDPYCADYPKSHFQTEIFKRDSGKYISLYFRLGTQYPKKYLEAVQYLGIPYWDMVQNVYHGLAYTYTFPELNHWDIQPQYPDKLVRYRMWLIGKIETDYYPFWRQPGLCIWLLAALSGLMIAKKEQNGLLKILPISLYFIGILMGPVALLRYLHPLMLATPILFGMMFQRKNIKLS